MSEIEGAICDGCGNRIGPYGCCSTIKLQKVRIVTLEGESICLEQEIKRLKELNRGIERLTHDGYLMLLDGCDNYAFCPEGRFKG